MEIVSKVEPKTITVTDIDIRFPGETLQLTLKDGDTITAWRTEPPPSLTTVRYASGEVADIFIGHALHISARERTIVLPLDPADVPHRPAK